MNPYEIPERGLEKAGGMIARWARAPRVRTGLMTGLAVCEVVEKAADAGRTGATLDRSGMRGREVIPDA